MRIIETTVTTTSTVADNIASSCSKSNGNISNCNQTTEMILNECGSFFLQGFVTRFISYLVWFGFFFFVFRFMLFFLLFSLDFFFRFFLFFYIKHNNNNNSNNIAATALIAAFGSSIMAECN